MAWKPNKTVVVEHTIVFPPERGKSRKDRTVVAKATVGFSMNEGAWDLAAINARKTLLRGYRVVRDGDNWVAHDREWAACESLDAALERVAYFAVEDEKVERELEAESGDEEDEDEDDE